MALFFTSYKTCRVIAFHAIFLSIILLLGSCEADESEVKKVTSRQPGIEEGKDVNIIYTQSGNAKARLFSPLMYRVKDTVSYVEFPKKIHVDFYTDTGKVESTLDALYGKYFENESKIFLRDSVRFIGMANGDTLYCSECTGTGSGLYISFTPIKKCRYVLKHILLTA